MAIHGPGPFQNDRAAECYGAIMHLISHQIDAEFARLAAAPEETESGVAALVGCLLVLVQAYPRAAQVSLPADRVAKWEAAHQVWLDAKAHHLPAKLHGSAKACSKQTFQALKDAYRPLAEKAPTSLAPQESELLSSVRAQECAASVLVLLGERLDREFSFLQKEPWPTDMGFRAWLTGIRALVEAFPQATRSHLTPARVETWTQQYLQWFQHVERRLPAKHRAEMRTQAMAEFARLLALVG